jgi:hypothetical protein
LLRVLASEMGQPFPLPESAYTRSSPLVLFWTTLKLFNRVLIKLTRAVLR